ncbi:MAG TPA: MFS transporter [Candidatus Saccharimonadales bacterium]|nr:MFS transporter [Candidatus Saccharimonadales bacterium]
MSVSVDKERLLASRRKNTELKFLILLGLPSLGLTFAVTTLSAYLPTILHSLTNPLVVGVIIGAEGLFGLFMPVIFGVLADRSKHVGDRLRYLVPSAFLMAGSLFVMGYIHILFLIGIMVALFYVGYYAFLAPYWAIYPDLIPRDHSGRSRSAESAWRGVGAVTALISGGFLLGVFTALPFIIAGGLVVIVTFLLFPSLGKRRRQDVKRSRASMIEAFANIYNTLHQTSGIRNLVIANSLWNATLRSILAFTVLFFTVGLNRSRHFVSAVIFPVAAIGIILMVPVAGKLADRIGHLKVLNVACLIYGIGCLAPVFTQRSWVIFIVPIVSGAAATVMVLPFALLMKIQGEDELHGANSGLFGLSRGIGSFAGPLLTGLAVYFGGSIFKSTNGYAAFWLASGIYILASLFFLRRIHERQPVT